MMYCCLSPATNPPPCTRIAAGKGPFPSGRETSMVRATPSTRAYTTSFRSSARDGTHVSKTTTNNHEALNEHVTLALFRIQRTVSRLDMLFVKRWHAATAFTAGGHLIRH